MTLLPSLRMSFDQLNNHETFLPLYPSACLCCFGGGEGPKHCWVIQKLLKPGKQAEETPHWLTAAYFSKYKKLSAAGL